MVGCGLNYQELESVSLAIVCLYYMRGSGENGKPAVDGLLSIGGNGIVSSDEPSVSSCRSMELLGLNILGQMIGVLANYFSELIIVLVHSRTSKNHSIDSYFKTDFKLIFTSNWSNVNC